MMVPVKTGRVGFAWSTPGSELAEPPRFAIADIVICPFGRLTVDDAAALRSFAKMAGDRRSRRDLAQPRSAPR